VIQVSVIMGGLELRIPTNWQLVNEVSCIFGGVEDNTAMPHPEMPGLKRLVVRGSTILGGVSFKN
jgi:hypothetical protein